MMDTPIRFEIVPHQGIGPVRLGMNRTEVEAALAPFPGALPSNPKRKGSRVQCYYRGSLQVEFTAAGTASFIEVSNDSAFLSLYNGHDVFDLPAPDLFSLFAADDHAGPHQYNSSEYLFPDLIVSLWEADNQYDRKGGYSRPLYATVGVGNADYLAAINALRAGTYKVP
jgi:hypothetical protein